MDVLDKIDKLRRERGWSINNLAMEAMLTQSTLNNLYSRHSEPKLSTLRTICQAFGITLSEFFADDDPDDGYTPRERELVSSYRRLTDKEKRAVRSLMDERAECRQARPDA